jgi:GH35 family endo-1,4-beta-xylanase
MKFKKIMSVLTAVTCCSCMFAYLPSFVQKTYASEIVHNDFEVTYEGWHGTDYDIEVTASDSIGYQNSRGMLVSGRKTAQDGAEASKGLYLVGDVDYNYSIQVFSRTDEKFHISLTCDDMDTQESTTTELVSQNVNANEWTELKASYKAPKNSCEFRITITTDTTNDFIFDELNITTKQTEKANAVFAATSEKGLKDEFADYFRVGNILNAGWGNGGTVANSAITANIIKDCNSIECENETKADSVLVKSQCSGTNIGVSLNAASTIIDFCIKNNIGFRGHAFVWHSQTPAWFLKENFNENDNWVSADVMNQRLESYMKNLFALYEKQYPTLDLYAYDICNECVSDDSNRTANNGGAREPGDNNTESGKSAYVAVYGDNSFVEKAFTYARKYAPSTCKLYYNDYNEYWDHKRDCIYNMCKSLYEKGVLDGVGMQSHIPANATGFAGTDSYIEAMKKYLSIGCDVQITELDISLENGKYTAQEQADKYKAIFQAAMDWNKNPQSSGKVTLVAIWGPNDANSWLKEGSDALLYDKNNQPKLAYTTLTSMIPKSEWGDGSNYSDSDDKPVEPNEWGWYFSDGFEGDTCSWEARGGDVTIMTSGRTAFVGNEALLLQEHHRQSKDNLFRHHQPLLRGQKAMEYLNS